MKPCTDLNSWMAFSSMCWGTFVRAIWSPSFVKRNMLCALTLGEPCPTFRHADKGLRPEQQLAFVFRTERTRAAYAFPQPQA